MKTIKRFSIWLLLLMQAVNGLAQNRTAFDVFSNQEYTYITKYKEIKDAELNLNREIEINYFAMRNEGAQNYSSLNAFIENLALRAWKDDKRKFDLHNLVKTRISSYLEQVNRKNRAYYNSFDSDINVIELKSIDINFVSICNNKITFKQNFEYSVASNGSRYYNNESELEINITEYFVADYFSQNISPLKQTFNPAQIKRLENMLTPYVLQYQEEWKSDEEKSNDDDESDMNEENNNANSTQKLKADKTGIIDVQEANYYWYGWGLIVEFPEYCKSTNMSQGESYDIFIPYHECKSILDIFPSYASFSKLTKPAHQFSNFDYFDIINNYNKFRQEPKITSLLKLNNAPEKPKTLIVGSYQTFKDKSKNYRGDFVYEFNTKASSFQKVAENTNYSYFIDKDNDKQKPQKKLNTTENKKNYVYDDKGNLIIKKSDEPGSRSDYYFFYNESNCYYITTNGRSNYREDEIKKISFENNELCFHDVCLSFNKKRQIDAIKSLKYQNNDVELGYDEKDRLIEAHVENDRYNYYYEYDELDRLVKYYYYEYQRLEKEVVYYYQDLNRLPYLQKKHEVNNDIFQEETYNWEY